MALDRESLLNDLKRDEGFRNVVYDDHTGKPIKTGSVVLGNPTIGYGWNLAATPLTIAQYGTILLWQADEKVAQVRAAFPWFDKLPPDVQRAYANMAFNMGVDEMKEFNIFNALLIAGKYREAADDLKTTKWYGQVGERAERIEELIRNAQSASVV